MMSGASGLEMILVAFWARFANVSDWNANVTFGCSLVNAATRVFQRLLEVHR